MIRTAMVGLGKTGLSHLAAAMVRKALERGLHVFCEKPFVLDLQDGERLVALAEAKGLVNQVGYHFRFVGAFMEAARIVGSGGETGWLYPPGDVDALASAMRACLSAGPDLLDDVGNRARGLVWASHDVDVQAGQLLDLITRGGAAAR